MKTFWIIATLALMLIIGGKFVGFLGEGTGLGSAGSASSASPSWMPKSEVPTSHNGVTVVGAFKKGGIQEAIGAK